MRYMFRVLVLGDPGLSLPFVVNGDLEQVSQDSELSRWSKEINIGYEDRCDLEVDVVVSTATDVGRYRLLYRSEYAGRF